MKQNPNRGLFLFVFSVFTSGLIVILVCMMWAISASEEDPLKLVSAGLLTVFLGIMGAVVNVDLWRSFVHNQNCTPRVTPRVDGRTLD